MGIQNLFPQPHQLVQLGDHIELAGRAVILEATAALPALAQRGVELAQTALPTASNGVGNPYRIHVQIDQADPVWQEVAVVEESYLLVLNPESGRLLAYSPSGIFTACQTIRQLFQDQPLSLPTLRIIDWPDFRHRGLYIESKWGPDLMELADWKALVDYMAALKFNSLGVGVYGCWVVQYDGQTTEFLMLPFPDHPQLQTPKTLRYYSPAAGDWQELTYLPRMFTEDFFGELVAYAKQNNITVRPHFNAPGHNTLIPRVYPEISARYEDGSPIGYGFCLSNPQSYEVIYDLYASVVERYLRPHGVHWFHIGLDEVTGYMGIDPARPFEVTDPWCRCPECQKKSHAQHLQEYAVRVCTFLKQQGITDITLWNDALESLGALNADFVQMLEQAGVRENVALQWWRYGEPTLIPRQELGLRSWVTPMAGYWSNLFTQSYTSNIYPMLLHGYRAGAEGADAYAIYDPAYDRNYTCLAQYAWNQTTSEDLYQFKSRYAQAKLGRQLDPHLAVEAFAKYDQVFDAMSWTEATLDSLLYYWHTYPAARKRGNYPYTVLSDLLDEHLRLRNSFQRLAAHARAARTLFAQAAQQANDPLLDLYRAECDKYVGVWETYALLLRAIEHYRQASGDQIASRLDQASESVSLARTRLLTVLADLERVKEPYLLPQILRDLSVLLVYCDQLQAEFSLLRQQSSNAQGTGLPLFAQLKVNQART